MSKLRLLIVDDHPIVNRGLASLEDDEANNITVVGQAYSGTEAVEIAKHVKPDVVLLDVRLPDLDGIEVCRRLKKINPVIRVVMLTTFSSRDQVTRAMEAGAEGFLPKEVSEDMIVRTIKAVFEGKILMSTDSEVATDHDAARSRAPRNPAIDKINRLSQREQEVLMLLVHGKDNAEIADELFISEHTVRNYVSRIYAILEVKNRTAAVIWAQDHGVV